MNQTANDLTRWTFGANNYTIKRFVEDPTASLRGWDTADEYLLQEAAKLMPGPRHWLIFNDDFGALTTACCDLIKSAGESPESHRIHVVQDTSLGREAIARNLAHNHAPETTAAVIVHEHVDTVPTNPPMDIVLAKVPKENAVLEQQLRTLRDTLINSQSVMLLAGMVKHLSSGLQKTLETYLGATERRLAVRKARLFRSTFEPGLTLPGDPYPRKQSIPELDLVVRVDAGVFASDKPDPATLFLCQNVPTLQQPGNIMDLGCGSGLLGIVASRKNSGSRVLFVDTSSSAVLCAKNNWQNNIATAASTESLFINQHRLQPWSESTIDMVLCNPPFHQKHTQTLSVARGMFADAHSVLTEGGRLLVVANRHLPYQQDLRRLFGNHTLVAENTRFRIHQCMRDTTS